MLFVTQAGQQSVDEALRGGVPLLALPLLGDQWFNAEQLQHHGAGRHLRFDTLSETQLNETVHALIDDKRSLLTTHRRYHMFSAVAMDKCSGPDRRLTVRPAVNRGDL